MVFSMPLHTRLREVGSPIQGQAVKPVSITRHAVKRGGRSLEEPRSSHGCAERRKILLDITNRICLPVESR